MRTEYGSSHRSNTTNATTTKARTRSLDATTVWTLMGAALLTACAHDGEAWFDSDGGGGGTDAPPTATSQLLAIFSLGVGSLFYGLDSGIGAGSTPPDPDNPFVGPAGSSADLMLVVQEPQSGTSDAMRGGVLTYLDRADGVQVDLSLTSTLNFRMAIASSTGPNHEPDAPTPEATFYGDGALPGGGFDASTNSIMGMFGEFKFGWADEDGNNLPSADRMDRIWWTYDLDETLPMVQALETGEVLYEKISLLANDNPSATGGGNESPSITLVVTIEGHSFPTDLMTEGSGAAQVAHDEDGSVAGRLTVNDPDNELDMPFMFRAGAVGAATTAPTDAMAEATLASATVSADAEIAGMYGTFSVRAHDNGDLIWSYDLDEDNTAVAGLTEASARLYDKLALQAINNGVDSEVEFVEVAVTGPAPAPTGPVIENGPSRANIHINGIRFSAVDKGIEGNLMSISFATAATAGLTNPSGNGLDFVYNFNSTTPDYRNFNAIIANVNATTSTTGVQAHLSEVNTFKFDDHLDDWASRVDDRASQKRAPGVSEFYGATTAADQYMWKLNNGAYGDGVARGRLELAESTPGTVIFEAGSAPPAGDTLQLRNGTYANLWLDTDGSWFIGPRTGNLSGLGTTATGTDTHAVRVYHTPPGGTQSQHTFNLVITTHGSNLSVPTLAYATDAATDGRKTVENTETGVTDGGTLEYGTHASRHARDVIFKTAGVSGVIEPLNPTSGELVAAPRYLEPRDIEGDYGTFSFARNNGPDELTWSYNLDEGNTAVSQLYAGRFLYDKVAIAAGDGQSDSAPLTLTVVIEGTGNKPAAITNAAPTVYYETSLAMDGYLTLQENATGTAASAVGTIVFDDAEVGNTALTIRTAVTSLLSASDEKTPEEAGQSLLDMREHTGVPSAAPGDYGRFSFMRNNTTGELEVTYTLTATSTDLQALDDREWGYDMLSVQVSDGTNNSAIIPIVARIQGQNDAPNPTAMTETLDSLPAATYQFSMADFPFADEDRRDALHHIRITDLPDHGSLETGDDGFTPRSSSYYTIRDNEVLTREEVGKMQYVTSTAGTYTDDSFSFQVHDGTAWSTVSNTIELDFA